MSIIVLSNNNPNKIQSIQQTSIVNNINIR